VTGAKAPEGLVLEAPEWFRFRGFPETDDHPMVYVAWADAAQYCRWAGGRLPTEAEWEYAARAGSPTARYGKLDEIAWYADNSGPSTLDGNALWEGASSPSDFVRQLRDAGNGTHPVGRKMPNDFGLFDMLGNVWEYCADWYGEKYYTVSPEKDPPGPSGGECRVMRGGAWRNIRLGVRVATRAWMLPDHRFGDNGFRCVRDASP
jgi:formylglycine-generating enzyme required for sulfatase activity